MGRMALILVLGLSLTVGIVAIRLNTSKTGLVENISGFDKYANARNIAHTGVNMMLRRLDRNDTTITGPLGRSQTAWLMTNLMSGLCTVSVRLTHPPVLDTIDITSKSMYIDTTRSMSLRLFRSPVPFPAIGEALGLRIPSVDVGASGTANNIDGRDHSLDGGTIVGTGLPGVGVLNSTDSGDVDNVRKLNITTSSGVSQIVVDPGMSDPSAYVQDYINAADYVYPAGTYGSNMTWGDTSHPVIVYANGQSGDVSFNGNITGCGILVVRGTLNIGGSFLFRGLIITYNDVTINQDTLSLGAHGEPEVVGAILAAGNANSDVSLKGNVQISYSSAALNKAKFINKLQVYRVLRWYE